MASKGRGKRSSICGECEYLEDGPDGPGGYVVVEKSGSVRPAKGKKSWGISQVKLQLCKRCKGLGDPFQGKA